MADVSWIRDNGACRRCPDAVATPAGSAAFTARAALGLIATGGHAEGDAPRVGGFAFGRVAAATMVPAVTLGALATTRSVTRRGGQEGTPPA
jgi:hypothetical protein